MNNIHETASISKLADIETSMRGSALYIGQQSFIDSFVKIKFVGGTENIWIGDNCYINSGCVLYSGNGIKIGNNVLIAANCTLSPVNHAISDKSRPIKLQGFQPSKGGITIEDDVWIGANTVILDGAFIPTGCVIGAGSLVKDKLEPYSVYAGNPLRLIKPR
ncbi:MAG: acyltransferase [Gammaproteobacteria bacterium]|jgi:acetyltransferase-like isoleucine patch superfamily enzyme|nr:acyltransferase [Gammaproteobacteria bacterium]